MGTPTDLGSKANQWSKKRGAKEVEEVDQVKVTTKKRKLRRRGLFEEHSRSETSEASSSSGSFYMDQKVSESNLYQDSKGFVTLPMSPEKALHAAKIRIRFADTIVKAKERKQLGESSNRTDAMKRFQQEKQVLVRSQREEIARIEAETKAARLEVRHKERLALEKCEEEAKSNIEDNLASEKEMVKLCGGSRLARTRWLKNFGLSLRKEEPELEDI